MKSLYENLSEPAPLEEGALRVIPLGGLGEVGRNMNVLEYRGKLLVVDCGVLFPEESQPGVDLILPDFSWIEERMDDVVGLVLTHGHEDHIGAVPYLLKRRPDVRQAERQLAAATANIGVATGALYPDISIGAQVGTIGILENLGEPSTNRWGFGPQISWTIPTNGTRARIRMAEASTQAALANFDGVVLNAIRETQTRLAQYSALLDRRDALAEAEKSAKEAADQTHRYYQAGRESFLADLQATRTYTDMRAQLAAANSQVALGQVGVFLALGGGWKDTGKP